MYLGQYPKTESGLEIIRAHNWPKSTGTSRVHSAYSDRCYRWDHQWHDANPLTGSRQMGYESDIETAFAPAVIECAKHTIGCGYPAGEKRDAWMAREFTGVRVCRSMNRATGYPVYLFELVA